ncbi:MAG: hypothetical protein R3F43_30360, partial [bacterium]
CDDTHVVQVDDPETDATVVETGDAGFTSPAFCPSQTTLFDMESLSGEGDDDRVPFANGELVIGLSELITEGGVDKATIKVSWEPMGGGRSSLPASTGRLRSR